MPTDLTPIVLVLVPWLIGCCCGVFTATVFMAWRAVRQQRRKALPLSDVSPDWQPPATAPDDRHFQLAHVTMMGVKVREARTCGSRIKFDDQSIDRHSPDLLGWCDLKDWS